MDLDWSKPTGQRRPSGILSFSRLKNSQQCHQPSKFGYYDYITVDAKSRVRIVMDCLCSEHPWNEVDFVRLSRLIRCRIHRNGVHMKQIGPSSQWRDLSSFNHDVMARRHVKWCAYAVPWADAIGFDLDCLLQCGTMMWCNFHVSTNVSTMNLKCRVSFSWINHDKSINRCLPGCLEALQNLFQLCPSDGNAGCIHMCFHGCPSTAWMVRRTVIGWPWVTKIKDVRGSNLNMFGCVSSKVIFWHREPLAFKLLWISSRDYRNSDSWHWLAPKILKNRRWCSFFLHDALIVSHCNVCLAQASGILPLAFGANSDC